jgi:hypothetical protein
MSELVLLSICIPTLNRADFIGATLDSIVPQLTPAVEVVVVDGGAGDETRSIVEAIAEHHPQIRYHRGAPAGSLPPGEGFDRDCDLAVKLSQGRHCWLFTDDDLIAPGAIRRVLDEMADGDPDLLLVDMEVRDLTLDRVLERSRLPITGRRDYGPADADAFLMVAGNALTFVGCVIIRRASWLERDRATYYGSLFVHAGTILQSPPLPRARILAEPLVQIRMGNALWGPRAFEIWMFRWPALIWSFTSYSDAAKAAVIAREPWHAPLEILLYRAYGSLGRKQVRQHLTGHKTARDRFLLALALALPGPVAHLAMTSLLAISRGRRGSVAYNLLVVSPNTNRFSRALGRLVGHTLPVRRRA